MAGSCSCCVSLEKVEEDITAYGMNLMNPPPSIDELLKLLQKVESLLKMFNQHPFDSTRSALQPVMKALVRNELLRHTNEDVKVSVVSCITEISRIFAPKYPYDDHKQMEEILQQTIMALKKLPDVTGCSYRKVVHILEIFAKARVCVVLLDLENESLIIEIFKIFLEAIRPYHPHNIFTWMKEIMTRLIDGSGELAVELLRPLLDSLKIDNQMDSPVASILGEKVLKDSAAIVKPYIAEALKSMSLNSDDYDGIVALLCNEMPKGKEMDDSHREKLKDTCTTNIMKPDNPEDVQPSTNVPKENQEGTGSHKLTGHPVKVGPSEPKFCEQVLQDDTHRDKLKDTCTTNIMKPDNREDVQPAINVPKENQEGTGSCKLTGSSDHHSLVPENNNNSTGTHGLWCQPKKNEILINEDAELVVLLPIGDVPQSQVQKKDSLHLGHTWGEKTKRTLCGTRKRGRDSRKNEYASDGDEERKSESSIINEEEKIKEHKEPSLQKVFGMHDIEESGDKATKLSVKDENHLNECANYKSGRKLATRKYEDSKRARTSKDHGAELIGAKIKVWWPLEQVFYEGVISSFDSETNKHEVIYDGGEVEKLRLHKERWEMLEDNSSQKMENESAPDTVHPVKLVHPCLQDSKRPCTIKEYGKELVGTRIKVWWPLDERFYEGVVSSFDRMKRKHTVIYDDGEAEKLRLDKELWEILENSSSHKDHGLDIQGHAVSSAMFYEGVISSFDSETNKHEVIYDGGEVEKLRLHKERWEVLEDNSSQKMANESAPDTVHPVKVGPSMLANKDVRVKMLHILICYITSCYLPLSDSKRPCTIKEYGKELVGTRIKVWWPLDERFYEGVVTSFNPMTRKHKVAYDDGEVEILTLHKQRWEMLENDSSQKDHGLDIQGHAVSSAIRSSKKKAKRHSSTGPNISSSKRS